jgi:CubicO group peptidase (beta-lactamase class C family)
MIAPHFMASSPESLGLHPDKVQALLARVEREVTEGLLPAAQFALARHGKIAAMRSFGRVLHEGAPEPATDDTLFCVFSCTKALTSALAWQLIERGELAPGERVVDVIPEFGSHGKDVVTVEQLLIHTAGFPAAPFDPARFLDREHRLARFSDWRLGWEPGSRYEYHPTSSMYVVAEILERRSGKTYGALVRERIAEPLGLPDLRAGLPRALHGRLADVEYVGDALTDADYARAGMQRPPETEVNEQGMTRFNLPEVREAGIPGGGATTTAASLALFYQALLADGRAHDGTQVWKPETVHMALQVRSGELRDRLTRQLANRSLGLIIAGDEKRTFRGFGHTNSPLSFGHGGAGGQIAWADPATGISLAYCTSGFDRNPLRMGRRGVGISSRAADCLASA